MTLSFSREKTQRGVILNHSLNPKELNLVRKVVEWDRPNDILYDLLSLAGRSVFFKGTGESHDDDPRLEAIQLIGAGGLGGIAKMLAAGEFQIGPDSTINPVNAENHAAALARISSAFTIDESGRLSSSSKSYVPLHGMTSEEAAIRALRTTQMQELADNIKKRDLTPAFFVPKLVAQGIFPDLFDNQGKNLCFQAYRIPDIDRLSGQLEPGEVSLQELSDRLILPMYLMGTTLRNMHSRNFAYMQAHFGNVGLFREGKDSSLFITDLGTLVDFSNEEFPDYFRAIDLYTQILNLAEILDPAGDNSPRNLFRGGERYEVAHKAFKRGLEGYFTPEILSGEISSSGIESLTRELLLTSTRVHDSNYFFELVSKLGYNATEIGHS